MKRLPTLLLGLAALALAFGLSPKTAKADAPFFYSGYWDGIPYGYGYFNYFAWPVGYWNYPYQYGYGYQNYPAATFGVLAYSSTAGLGGFAWGESSIDAASAAALSHCAAADCQPVVWVSNGCAALSTSPGDTRLGWAYADTKQRALAQANRACRASGGVGCTPRGWVCSY